MEARRCACGCGKILVNPHNSQKYFDAKHRRRFYYCGKSGIPVRPARKKALGKMTPRERWESMTLEELSQALLKMHKSYGEVQSMYYNGTLPEDFGLEEKK